jgi:BirA family biotin operon repressor/biotin-[acetyl-CoA-carboxylase] ligase
MASDGESHLPPIELLELLSDGKLHSGQELANFLGVSRTAVWKQLSKLEAFGLELESLPGRGYCLTGGLEFLNEQSINAELSSSTLKHIGQLEILRIIDSTNAHLLKQEPKEKITVCMAECQTAGRGRRGRNWVSPFAKNIYLSLKMTLDSGLGALEGLSLAVGVAIVRALNNLGVQGVQLKWPNDVLWCGRKLGGILIEVVGDPSGRCHIVVGIGLNINADKTMLAAIEQPWVSLNEILGYRPVRNLVVAGLLNGIVTLLTTYEGEGFGKYRKEWEELNAHAGLLVNLHLGSTVVSGFVRGVNAVGALILSTEGGEQIFHGGEVSLRVAE